MQNIKYKIECVIDYLRSCLNCGSLFTIRTKLLCEKCYASANVDQSTRPFLRQIKDQIISGYSLWDWIPEKNDVLSNLLVSLKGGKPEIAMQKYAEELLKKRISLGGAFKKNMAIVPAPSTSGKKDHASVLAQKLSDLTGLIVIKALKKVNNPENDTAMPNQQRGKTKNQRLRLKIELNENFTSQDFAQRHVIFVDDITTTGATAIKAKAALGKCSEFEVWCLANRLVACVNAGDLL